MTLHETLKKAIPDAMRARDQVKLATLRSLITAMTNEAVAKGKGPDAFLADEEALTVLKRASNQRKDSIEQFEKGGRPELAEPEKAELAIIEGYLPAKMPREEVEKAVKAKIAELGVSSKSEAGRVMGIMMKMLTAADGADVKAVVDDLLS